MGLNLNVKDVEAIAKSRVGREHSKTTNYWYYGLIIALMGGVLLFRVASIAGWAVIIIAVVGFVWYSVSLTRKQNIAARKLIREWQDEQVLAEDK